MTCQHTTCPECSPQSQHDGVTCTAPECQFLCPHMYTCDKKCYDFNNEHICKHIHKVHSLAVKNRKETKRYTESVSSTATIQESESPPLTRKTWRIPTLMILRLCTQKPLSVQRKVGYTIKYYSNLHEYGHPIVFQDI